MTARDEEKSPYSKLTYVLPRYNNDLWGLVEVNTRNGEITMRKELETEERNIVLLVKQAVEFFILLYCILLLKLGKIILQTF